MNPQVFVVGIVALALSSAQADSKLFASDRAFFETKIRPALVAHCYECHSASSEKVGGKLLLDHREGIRRGGESGPAIMGADPGNSLLMDALHWNSDLEMPPEEPLPDSVIQDFAIWIKRGAPDPRTGTAPGLTEPDKEQPSLWSFQPVAEPSLPNVRNADWPFNEIDQLVLSGVEQAGLHPAGDASPRVLIRRLSFDLVGLPPRFEEIEEFVREYHRDRDNAVATLVDRLLDSPHFGERWGRRWLDIARYAESNGNDGLSRNPTFPHAWRYRDYVIQAFNDDVPYDRFLAEQIAGDLLPAKTAAERDRLKIATGFLALGAKPAKAMNNNFAMDVVADQIDVIGRGVMGISVGCARCHDHKTDPITTKDYYALAGIFTSTETMWGLAANEKLTAPPTDLHVLEAAKPNLPPKDFVETVLVLESNTGKPKPIPKSKWETGTPLAMGVRDRKEPADCKINLKGDAKKLGESVSRGYLTGFTLSEATSVDPKQSGRVQLAQWLTHPSHPLTARVMVNRIWLHLFGSGIVRTPDDFGVYGEPPIHPELLDYLATRFVENGWSVKQLIREIAVSRTYQLGSGSDPESVRQDPENLLLARHNRRRLDAEALRDSMLQVSGNLNPAPAAGSLVMHRDILVNLAGSLHQASHHRSVYLCYLRNSSPPELAAFDLPDFREVKSQRNDTVQTGQALFLYNHPFIHAQATVFAQSLNSSSSLYRIQEAYQRAFGRTPTESETGRALSFLKNSPDQESAWRSFCQALFATNEFRYID
ncbi:MAG: PSD1 and planctomycete cytochrome C domain-containing protein [Verrucomicrobiota bacterium]